MAISNKDLQKIAMFGAIAGLATPFIMKWLVMPVLNFLGGILPAFSLKLAENGANPTISVAVRDSLTGIEGGLSGWLVDSLGLTLTVPFQTFIMGAIGGALFFVVGAYVADMAGMLKGDKFQKTRIVIFVGSIAAGLLLGSMAVPEIGIDLINTLIAFLVNAAVLAWVYVWIDKQMKLGMVPF